MSKAQLNWTPPATRTDGSSLDPSQIAGADVYDSASATPTTPIGSVTGAVGTFTTGDMTAGDHTFTVVTRDVEGNSSAPSNAVTGTIVAQFAPPAAVSDLTVAIIP